MDVNVAQLSLVIPSYQRGEVLLDTIRYLLELPVRPDEILVVDQTEQHPPEMLEVFQALEVGSADGLAASQTLENSKGDFPNLGKTGCDFSEVWKKSFQSLETTRFRRIVLSEPSIPHAMNVGLQEAKGDIVLFLDDDLIPNEQLVSAHVMAHEMYSDASAVVGQVLQPEDGWETAETLKEGNVERRERKAEGPERNAERLKGRKTENKSSGFQDFRISKSRSTSLGKNHEQRTTNKEPRTANLRRDLGFKFNSAQPVWVENVMAGNLSVKREAALRVGGFDENFIPPVSYRFETEFAKRLVAAGGKIRFEPSASIKHLRAGSGGTRSRGSHLTSASPVHGVGDYYYALRCGRGIERVGYILRRPFREVCTRFHLLHPWFIPVKLFGESRAMILALTLYRRDSLMISAENL